MPTPIYDIGDGIHLPATFKDAVTGVLTDPTTVVLTLQDPAGLLSTPSVTHASTGQYFADFFAANVSGTWIYRWVGTGTVAGVEEGQFYVKPSFDRPPGPNAIDLTTLAKVKDWIQSMVLSQTSDDATLQRLITSVSQYFLTCTDRKSLKAVNAYSERYDGNAQDQILTLEWPITAVTLVKIGTQVVSQTPDYVLRGWSVNQNKTGIVLIPGCGPGRGFPYLFWKGRMNVQIDYSAGYSGVPADIEEACNTVVVQNFKRRAWVDQASIALPEGGGTTTYRSWDIPPQVQKVLGNYRRWHY